jgi:ribonuclease HII
MAVIVPTLRHERRLWNDGLLRIAGVDEVGVAPTCGAVVAAAVIIRPNSHRIPGVRDSKTLSMAQRERLAPLIRARAVAIGVGAASVREIDQLNIYHATHLAMRRAIARLGGHDHVIVDGNRISGFESLVGPYTNVVDGDAKVYSVACASVVAKVVRDRMMTRLAARYPGYGWEHNQGYATRDHREAIRRLGLTPFHRRSFLALQRTLAGDQLDFDLLGDPAASAAVHDRLDREGIPVMADDAILDARDLEFLDGGANEVTAVSTAAPDEPDRDPARVDSRAESIAR